MKLGLDFITIMPNYRRYHVPHAIYFITLTIHARKPMFADPQSAQLLLDTLHAVKNIHSFDLLAYCILPDHLHLLLKPNGRATASSIVHSLKRNFTINLKSSPHTTITGSPWQDRFWDHVIRNEKDLAVHLDYIHYNPVKHGLVNSPENYTFSSYPSWRDKGFYQAGWGEFEPESTRSFEYE